MTAEEVKDKVKSISGTNPELVRLASAKELIAGVRANPGSLSVISLEESKIIAYYSAMSDLSEARRARVREGIPHRRFIGINSFLLHLEMCRPSVDGIRAEQFKDAIMQRPAAPLELPSATPEVKRGIIDKIGGFIFGNKPGNKGER